MGDYTDWYGSLGLDPTVTGTPPYFPASSASATASSSSDWMSGLTGFIGAGVDAYSKIKAADALKTTQVASDGAQYTHGAFNAGQAVVMPTGWMLIGAAVLLLLFIEK